MIVRPGQRDFDVRSFRFFGTKTEFTAGFLDKHLFRSGIEWRWMAGQYDYDVRERQPRNRPVHTNPCRP